MKYIKIFFTVFITFSVTFVYGQVNTNLVIRQPVPHKLSQWEQDPTIIQLTLQNTTSSTYPQAHVSIVIRDESGNVIVQSENNNAAIPTFTIPAGPPQGSGVLMLNGQDVIDVNALNIDPQIRNTIVTTNSPPEGTYEVCFSVLDQNGNVISTPSENCTYINITLPEPPTLIAPKNQVVQEQYPQFVWSPATDVPSSQNVVYRLLVAPRFDGQLPRTALESNSPIIDHTVPSTSYQYSPMDVPFDYYPDAKSFVWQVQALDQNTGESIGYNHGKSEIGEFTLPKEPGNIGGGGIVIDTSFTTPPISYTPPTSTIHGRVAWKPGDPPSGNNQTNNSGQTNGNGSANYQINGNVVNNPALNFNGITYPIKNTNVDIYTTSPRKFLGSTTTDSDGNFEISFTNIGTSDHPAVIRDGYTIEVNTIVVDPQEPHFAFPDNALSVSMNNDGVLAADDLYGYVKHYKFKPRIVDATTGSPIPGAKVDLLRWPRVYTLDPTLEPEISSNPETENWHGSQFDFFSTVTNNNTAKNLIVADNPLVGAYYLKVYATGYDTAYGAVVNRGVNYDFNSKPLEEKTFRLTAKLPIVEGKVVQKNNLDPIAGLTVSLTPQNANTPRYTTTTDDEGNFFISQIQVESDPYQLKVEGNQIDTHTEDVYLTHRGIDLQKYPLKLDAILFAVKGKIVSENNQPEANARLQWQSGGNPFYSDANGNFFTLSPPGQRTLIVSKIGFNDKTLPVNVTGSTENAFNLDNVGNNLSDYFGGGSFGDTNFDFSSLGLGNNSNNSGNTGNGSDISSMMFMDFNLGNFSMSPDALDLGFIDISRISGKLQVTVLDSSTDNPIQGAKLVVNEKSALTSTRGKALLTDIQTGDISFTIASPANQSYVPRSFSIYVPQSVDTVKTTVRLQQGATLSGVTGIADSSATLDSVKIRLDGRPDIFTYSDANGNYTLRGIPAGSYKVYATKQGFLGDSKTFQFSTSTLNHDFALVDPDFKIDKLYGFDVEVDELNSVNDTLKLTGAFVNLPRNQIFYPTDNYRLPFTDIPVKMYNGKIIGAHPKARTDAVSMPVKLFNFVYGNANASNISSQRTTDRIYVSSQLGGMINCDSIKLDFQKTFKSNLQRLGWEFRGNVGKSVKPAIFSNQTHMIFANNSALFNALAKVALDSIFKPTSINFKGFTMALDLSHSQLDSTGLKLKGHITLHHLADIDSIRIGVDSLWIDRTGLIREESHLDVTQAYAAIDSLFKIKIDGIDLPHLNEGKLSGTLHFTLPHSNPSTFTFAGLKFDTTRVYGGQFGMPGEGIDIFKKIKFVTDENGKLDFKYDESSEKYYLSGAGYLKIEHKQDKKLLNLVDSLRFNNFAIKSNGNMSYTIKTDLRRNFGNVLKMEFHTFRIDTVDGGNLYGTGRAYFQNIPFVYGYSHFEFSYQAKYGIPRLDSLSVDIRSPIATVTARGHGVESNRRLGFKADGYISLFGGVARGAVDFFDYWYFPKNGSPAVDSVRAKFKAAIGIPIGNINIAQARGIYYKDRTHNTFLFDLTGQVHFGSLLPVALNPIRLTIKNGPLITGSADLTVLNHRFFNVTVNVDKPNKYFRIAFKPEFEVLPNIVPSVSSMQELVISSKPGDQYWCLNFVANAHVPHLASGNFSFVLGQNAHIGQLGYSPPSALHWVHTNNFTGVLARASIHIGKSRSNAAWHRIVHIRKLHILIADAYLKSWLFNYSQAYVFLNAYSSSVGFYVGSNWQAGAAVKAETGLLPDNNIGNPNLHTFLAQAGLNVNGQVAGGYSASNGYYFNGSLNGQAHASIGGCGGNCNGVRVCAGVIPPHFNGIQICKSVGLDVDFTSSNGLSVNVNI